MDKIELGTADGTAENIERLAALFPQVITEVESAQGKLEHAVDFDALRDLLGDVAEGTRERYQFTWPGKREAKAEARRPIYKTMIPELDKSKDWDTTENLYIEGDNLDALKLLKETYAGKVKLIYIDPPTFSNSARMHKRGFDVQVDHSELIIGASRLLTRTGSIIFSCNLRGFEPDLEKLDKAGIELEDVTASTIPRDFERNARIHHCYLARRVR